MRLALPSLLLLFAPVTFALDTTRSISQYGHTTWTLQEGALSGAPTDMAQTTDGSLWIDTRSDLERWQNGHLIHYPGEGSVVTPQLDDGKLSVSALLVDHHNALWIGTAGDGLYRLHGGKVSHYRAGDGLSNNTVHGLFEDREGTLWVLTAQGIASLDFSITPTFYQTHWFDALCVIAIACILWLLYLARVRQIEMRIRMRIEERVIERERIARDLHDTLLQSVQGLILRFQAVLARIPEGGERPLQMMEQALERADQVLAEGLANGGASGVTPHDETAGCLLPRSSSRERNLSWAWGSRSRVCSGPGKRPAITSCVYWRAAVEISCATFRYLRVWRGRKSV
jgi:hypothetical protein